MQHCCYMYCLYPCSLDNKKLSKTNPNNYVSGPQKKNFYRDSIVLLLKQNSTKAIILYGIA